MSIVQPCRQHKYGCLKNEFFSNDINYQKCLTGVTANS